MPGKKLVIVGGGSAYIPGFVKAMLADRDKFADWQVALYDIDIENLNLIAELSHKMARSAEAAITFSAEPDLARALEGADYVLTSFRAGGFEMRLVDEKIPLDFGVIGHETVGPGGFFYALRTIPVIRNLVEHIERICPGVTLLNYTNPTNIVTEAVCLHSDLRIYGMCDQPIHDTAMFARWLGYPDAAIESASVGLNHATWGVTLKLDGKDMMPGIRREAQRILDEEQLSDEERLQVELAAVSGLIPSKYNQYYYYRARTVERVKKAGRVRTETILDGMPEIFAHLREQAQQERPQVVKHRGSADFGDFAINILAALSGGMKTVEPLNVVNRGLIDDLPEGLVVEVPCAIEKDKVTPRPMGRLPEKFAGLLYALGNFQRLTARAAWSGDYEDAVLALAANPLIGDLDLATGIYDRMAADCIEYLPERLHPAK